MMMMMMIYYIYIGDPISIQDVLYYRTSILAKPDYIEVDIMFTYNKNTDLPYLWNVTANDCGHELLPYR